MEGKGGAKGRTVVAHVDDCEVGRRRGSIEVGGAVREEDFGECGCAHAWEGGDGVRCHLAHGMGEE